MIKELRFMILEVVRSMDDAKGQLTLSSVNPRLVLFLVVLVFMLSSCDSNRVYEDNIEFKDRTWKTTTPAELEFDVSDTTQVYNLYLDVRNSLDYPYARLFVNYQLVDPNGSVVKKEMLTENLFDIKTGEPNGRSGLGDVYDHQFGFLTNYSFEKAGKHKVRFEQFMRQDTLPGILAVGLRVETIQK
ncbi:MAG: gliding motility lipoprotein GldH [Cytophagales bacterium]|jgi:gliding motility-associated lipoprotein GldH|nr:gliding motility lipoprotein GldH [Cytophagales bacterium]MCA6387142.1 gliding motility lipoprotein GldH [Cytophagales bacterium]MCA6390387.1 gliding motility lipoprotein GldH [Cytophagales bacterium]MCA6395600.1 gliding motility lipoprotein GldH [Cytophagales bacterium]MCA6399705.1 gliding motility lipoprotein GldH [Cytophagales bacterium]